MVAATVNQLRTELAEQARQVRELEEGYDIEHRNRMLFQGMFEGAENRASPTIAEAQSTFEELSSSRA